MAAGTPNLSIFNETLLVSKYKLYIPPTSFFWIKILPIYIPTDINNTQREMPRFLNLNFS